MRAPLTADNLTMRGAIITALRLRGSLAIVAAALVMAAGALVVGEAEVPFPASPASNGTTVPYMVLAPTLVSIALTLRRPYGSEWMELGVSQPPVLRVVERAVLAMSLLLITLPPLTAGVSTGLVVIGLRDIALLGCLGRIVARYTSRLAGAILVVTSALATFSFGWAASGLPRPWAVLLADPDNGTAWLVLLSLLILCARLRQWAPSDQVVFGSSR